MLTDKPFYHGTIKKLVTAFGTLFNNISIDKAGSGNVNRIIKIPLTYSPKNLWYARIKQHSSIDDDSKVRRTLPRMGFEYFNPTYDSTRKLNTIQRRIQPTYGNNSNMKWQWQRVPYMMDFSLFISVNREEDGLKIIEQILPYFTPELNVTIRDNEDIGQSTDVAFVLNTIDKPSTYEGDYPGERIITWTISFNTKFYLYPPTNQSSIIKKVIVDLYDRLEPDASRVYRVETQPNPLTAGPEDNYGFLFTETYFDDGKTRVRTTGIDAYDLSSSSSSNSSSSELSSSSSSWSISSNSSSSTSLSSQSSVAAKGNSSSSSSDSSSSSNSSSSNSSSSDSSSSSNSSSSNSSSSSSSVAANNMNTIFGSNTVLKVFKISGQFTTTVKDSLTVGPTYAAFGTAFDGTNTLLSEESVTDPRLVMHSGQFTTTVKSSMSVASINQDPTGITSTSVKDTIWSGTASIFEFLYQTSGQFTSTIKQQIQLWPTVVSLQDVSWDGTDTMVVDRIAQQIFKFSGMFSTTLIDSLSFPMGSTGLGVSWNGTNVLMCETGLSKLFEVSGFTSTILSSMSTTSIGAGPGAIESNNRYNVI